MNEFENLKALPPQPAELKQVPDTGNLQMKELLQLELEMEQIGKDKKKWFYWTVKNPDLSEKLYPIMNKRLAETMQRKPDFVGADVIGKLSEGLFPTVISIVESLLGREKEMYLRDNIVYFSDLLKTKFSSEVEQLTFNKVKPIFEEVLEYLLAEMSPPPQQTETNKKQDRKSVV